MKKLNFATSNSWKFNQAYDYFKTRGIIIKQAKLELPESRDENPVNISKEKAEFAYKTLNEPVFVLDGAFFIKAYNDFPKTFVKLADNYLGAKGILKLLEGENNRNWEFPNTITYKDSSVEKTFSNGPKGVFDITVHEGLGYNIREINKIMIPDGYDKTYSEFTEEENKDYEKKVWAPLVFDEFIDWFLKYSNKYN